MSRRRGCVVIRIAVGLYLIGAGMLAGVIAERMRFDGRRAEILARYEQALAVRNMQLMAVEARRF